MATTGRGGGGELPCSRLGQNTAYGLVDVCGEPAGHQVAGEGTPHKGRYYGMTWIDRPEYGQGKIRIIDPGNVMGAANAGELAHQKKRRPPEQQPAPGFRVGKRTKRPHHPEGWHPGREVEFNPELAERRRKRS